MLFLGLLQGLRDGFQERCGGLNGCDDAPSSGINARLASRLATRWFTLCESCDSVTKVQQVCQPFAIAKEGDHEAFKQVHRSDRRQEVRGKNAPRRTEYPSHQDDTLESPKCKREEPLHDPFHGTDEYLESNADGRPATAAVASARNLGQVAARTAPHPRV